MNLMTEAQYRQELATCWQLIEQAQAEIAALRKDAERYRKWRADYTGDGITDMLIDLADASEPAEVDAAIDAAHREKT